MVMITLLRASPQAVKVNVKSSPFGRMDMAKPQQGQKVMSHES